MPPGVTTASVHIPTVRAGNAAAPGSEPVFPCTNSSCIKHAKLALRDTLVEESVLLYMT